MATQNDFTLEGMKEPARRLAIKKLPPEEVTRILLENFCRETIGTIRKMVEDDDEFVKRMKLTQKPTWTQVMVERLKKYIDGSRYFLVFHGTDRVYGMDDRHPDFYTSDREDRVTYYGAQFYLQEYDDARPEGHLLEECKPDDFTVVLLKPVKWQGQDPNWKEADPKSWAEFSRYSMDPNK